MKQELIGLIIEITSSKNKSNIGMIGTIINETKNTITIMQERPKKLLKQNITFITTIDQKKVKIDGSILALRPEERIKKLR